MTGASANWGYNTSAKPDTFVIWGIFGGAVGDSATCVTALAADDIITGISVAATIDTFGVAGTPNGAAVPNGESRKLWLKFLSPTTASDTTTQTIKVTVGCQVAE